MEQTAWSVILFYKSLMPENLKPSTSSDLGNNKERIFLTHIFRPDQTDVVERLKTLGGYIVVTDDYLSTPEFKKLVSDLPAPKLALNCVGGPTSTEFTRLLAPGGTMVTYGGMSRKPVTVPTSALIFKDVQLRGFWLTKWLEQHPQEDRTKMLNQLFEMIKKDQLKLWIEDWKFARFQQALQRVNEPYRDRKVVLTMNE